MVTEIMTQVNCGFLWFHVQYPFNLVCYPCNPQVQSSANTQAKPYRSQCAM